MHLAGETYAPRMDRDRPPLTIVVATTHRSSSLARCVAALRGELVQAGGELVLADGSRDGSAVTPQLAAGAHVVRMPGADVFRLRAAAARVARGRIVGFTEDHCVPEPGWCAAIIAAHEAHPEAAAVAGATSNGSDDRLVDRANFLVTFAPMLPPLPPRHGRVPPPNNISIKAEVLEAHDLQPGFVELELMPHLLRVDRLVLDDRVRVSHVQSHGRRGSVIVHFHNGRCATGLPRRRLPVAQRVRRIADSVLLAPRHLAETVREIVRRPIGRRRLLAAMPWASVLLAAHATGQVAGVLTGPGASPRALE